MSGATIPVAAKDMSKVVSLVKADTTGREADQVYFGPDYANFVAVTGNDPGAKTTESLWWLTDAGARFGVDDTRDVREALGLKTKPSLAPWVALRLASARSDLVTSGCARRARHPTDGYVPCRVGGT